MSLGTPQYNLYARKSSFNELHDFYVNKLGMVASYHDPDAGFASLAVAEGSPDCIMLNGGDMLTSAPGYIQPKLVSPPDTASVTFISDDVDADYARLKAAGVEFISEPVTKEDWGIRTVMFRDPEGNLLDLTQTLAG